MHKLVFFSKNINKIKEVKKIIKKNKFSILTLDNYPELRMPKEDGKTFKDNAIIKANFGFKKFGMPCFADDSGICINALNDAPGTFSKRFQAENGGLKKTIKLIINEVKKQKNYNAFFQTTIAFTNKENFTICFDGIIKGAISTRPMGMRGFDYDPIFIPNGNKKTYAQMLFKEKNLLSHRAQALKKFEKYLNKLFY